MNAGINLKKRTLVSVNTEGAQRFADAQHGKRWMGTVNPGDRGQVVSCDNGFIRVDMFHGPEMEPFPFRPTELCVWDETTGEWVPLTQGPDLSFLGPESELRDISLEAESDPEPVDLVLHSAYNHMTGLPSFTVIDSGSTFINLSGNPSGDPTIRFNNLADAERWLEKGLEECRRLIAEQS